MTALDITSALAAEHIHDLQLAGQRRRLAALARCCQPAAWKRAGGRIGATAASAAAWLRRGQLGPADNYCGCA
jgi:hypothetical protein